MICSSINIYFFTTDTGRLRVAFEITQLCKKHFVPRTVRRHIPPSVIGTYWSEQKLEGVEEFIKSFTTGSSTRNKLKLVVLGNGGVGKTTLINFLMYCNQPFKEVCSLTRSICSVERRIVGANFSLFFH